MKESFTAAIVVRSLLAAFGAVWVVGLLVGWVVDRFVTCWPVLVDVVVAVDMGFRGFFVKNNVERGLKTPSRPSKQVFFEFSCGGLATFLTAHLVMGISVIDETILTLDSLLQAPATVATSNRPLTAI